VPAPRFPWRLLAALALPAALGAVGMFGLRSISATFFLYLLGGCVVLPWLLLGARPLARRGGLPFAPVEPGRRRVEWILGVVFGPMFLAIYALVRPWIGEVTDYQARVTALGMNLGDPAVTLVVFGLLNPLLEEWWWRGQATPRCCAAFGRRRGIALAAAGFGVYHVVLLAALFPLPLALVRAVFIAGAGWLWSRVAVAERSWRAVYVAHLAADLAMVTLFVLIVLPR
jgi:hypothetical protein